MVQLCKKVLFISCVFINIALINGQTFEVEISTSSDESPYDAIELENGNYIVLSEIQESYSFPGKSNIGLYALNSFGDVLRSKVLAIDSIYSLISLQNMFIEDSNQLIILGNAIDNTSLITSQLLCISSVDFELISDTLIPNQGVSESSFDFIVNQQGNIVTVGKVNYEPEKKLLIKEFSKSGLLIENKEYEWSAWAFTSIVEDINNYLVVTNIGDNAVLNINKKDFTIMDTAFYSTRFSAYKIIANVTHEDFVIAGRNYMYPTDLSYKLGFIKVDHNMQLSDINLYGQSDTSYWYNKECISFSDNSEFFLAGTHNVANTPPYLYPEPRWIFMNKLKTDGSIIWQRFYKGEVNYMPYKVLATSDGGALILSHKYDWNDPVPDQRDIHILKVDSTGWYDGLVNVGDDGRPLQILVYPNPVRDRVHFEPGLYSDLRVQLFDINGKLMAEHPLHERLTLDMSGYKTGVYVYMISSEKGFLEKGKLIKE